MQSKHNEKISQHLKDLVSIKVNNKHDDSEWLSVLFIYDHKAMRLTATFPTLGGSWSHERVPPVMVRNV